MRVTLNLEKEAVKMGYQTEQKKVLLDYLSQHSDQAFSIDELAIGMKADTALSSVPGKSTLYRLISQLVEEGRVKRFTKGHSRHFLYQMVSCPHCTEHLHLRCTICGKLYHMEDQESAQIVREILELLKNGRAYERQMEGFAEVKQLLSSGEQTPSLNAADEILRLAGC